MDARPPSDVQATGTLPLSGAESVPVTAPASAGPERPAWVKEARDGLAVPGKYLAYEEEAGRHVVAPLTQEWTRIGRSLAADIRFDDATVSRRHALVVSQDDGVRVLDDRSLNGIYVNGEPGRVEPADRRRRGHRRAPRAALHRHRAGRLGAPPRPRSPSSAPAAAGRRRR